MLRREWKIRELLDFQYFLQAADKDVVDSGTSGSAIFDRDTYVQCGNSYCQKEPSRPTLLMYWLKTKRENKAHTEEVGL